MHVLHPDILSNGKLTLATVLVMMSFLKILTPPHTLATSDLSKSKRVRRWCPRKRELGEIPVVAWGVERYCVRKVESLCSSELLS